MVSALADGLRKDTGAEWHFLHAERIPFLPEVVLSQSTLALTEEGTGTSSVRLDRQPGGNVVVSVSSNAGATSMAPATLTYSTTSWNTVQTAAVTGVEDTGPGE